MKKKNFIICLIILFLFTACNKKKKENEELTPLNAPAKYGETMGKAMKKAEAVNNIRTLKSEIYLFFAQEGRYPNSLNELVDKGYIKEIPTPPKGMSYSYDPTTGKVELK